MKLPEKTAAWDCWLGCRIDNVEGIVGCVNCCNMKNRLGTFLTKI